MSQPISPSIIINERFDARPSQPVGYNVAVTGFTSEGVANEPFAITSITDYISLFGAPDASRPEQIYAYDSVNRIITGGANAIFTKLPYGADRGYDVGEEYSALLFPSLEDTQEKASVVEFVSTENLSADEFGSLSATAPFDDGVAIGDILSLSEYTAAEGEGVTIAATEVSGVSYDTLGYVFGEPVRVALTEEDYEKVKCGNIDWSENIENFDPTLSAYDSIEFGKSGLIVLDNGRTRSTDSNEGYYVTLSDNSAADPATDWDSITQIKTSTSTTNQTIWGDMPVEKYDFNLSSLYTANVSSVSQSLGALASQTVSRPWENSEYQNWLTVTLWRLSKDIRQGSEKLIPSIVETYTGSISDSETVIGDAGTEKNAFLGDLVEGSSTRLDFIVNPNLSTDIYQDTAGNKIKNTRVWRTGLGGIQSPFPPLGTFNGTGDAMFSVSQFTPKVIKEAFDVGNIPAKIQAALCTIDNPDRVEIDLSIEAGLGTIWTSVKNDVDAWLTGDPDDNSFIYNDGHPLSITKDLGRTVPEGSESGVYRENWMEVFDQFYTFTKETRICNGGNHHLHIADPLRQILVNGVDCKVYTSKTKCKNSGVFVDEIYHPLKNLTKLVNTDLATIDAEWYKTNNVYTSKGVWVPSSGVLAGLFAATDLPWESAAGVQRGLITGVTDIALDPTQRDRDYLWKIHANAVYADRSTGITRFADQTLLKNDNIQLRQNSARRLMIWLEKNLRTALRPFLFEPNNLQTRIRFKNAIELYLRTLLDNGAIVDYAVSLSRNDAATQQEGCLIADIAIKITGQVDKIILNFDLLRLDQPFQEVF
jgi:hypothetical protein